MENNDKHNTVAVFGGSGNMGRLAAGMFEKSGYSVIVSDPQSPDSVTPQEAIQQASILYFSIFPIKKIVEILESLKPDLNSEYSVLDNASVKNELRHIYAQLDEQGVSVCSTHPLIKHDQSPYGQKAIVIPYGTNGSKAAEIAEKMHNSVGMKNIELTFSEHDDLMVAAQLIPHLVMRSVWHTLKIENVNIDNLIQIAPANLQLFLLSMFRTVIQDPKISAAIIKKLIAQPKGLEMSESFFGSLSEILKNSDENYMTEKFMSDFDQREQEKYQVIMNESTSVALERLNNLNARSIVLECDFDRPGLLREVLLPFENNKISLTAIDSHKTVDHLKFEIGLDTTTYTPESIKKAAEELETLGLKVTLPK